VAFKKNKAGGSVTNSCRCEKIEKELEKAKKRLKQKLAKLKSLKKLAAKKLAKKVATLPLKAVPFLGWAMAVYDVYDVVTTGIDIADLVEAFNKEANIVENLHKKWEKCLGKSGKKVDLDDPKSMKNKTSKESGKKVDLDDPKNLDPTQAITKSKKQMKRLKDEIVKDGEIKESIKYVEENGKKYIVDGHHRQKIAKELGMNVPIEKVKLPYKGYQTEADLEYSQY
jgi:hypothetical protein